MIAWIRFAATTVLLLSGLFVCCVGVYGVFRFRYAANRMHAAAINDTMGVSLCVLGFAISAPDGFTALKLLLVVVFLWISAPVSSHLLCRLEIETNEDRAKYMNIHADTLAREREALAARQALERAEAGVPQEELHRAEDGAFAHEPHEAGEEGDCDGGIAPQAIEDSRRLDHSDEPHEWEGLDRFEESEIYEAPDNEIHGEDRDHGEEGDRA